jgi:AraC-like DNA-binding protein
MPADIDVSSLFYRDADSSYAFEEHVHFQHQWYCVVQGDVETVVNGNRIALRVGESVVVKPGARRAPRCTGKPPSYIVAIFENHALALDDVAERVLRMPAELRPDLSALVNELKVPGADGEALLHALLVRLLIGLARHNRDASEKPPEIALAARVERFIQANLHRALTRSDVAASVRLSPPHLARLFRRATGRTLGRRLTELRIERAQSLLEHSTMNVTQVAVEVGFSSFSHFSKVFRQTTGYLPSEYRRAK